MNLIYEQWIPVRLADGSPDKIAPYEITRSIGDEEKQIIMVASPRPDFDGALIQFLIGLLQTTCTPKTDKKWWDWRDSPPTPEILRQEFDDFKEAFDIDVTDACGFMQERLVGKKGLKEHPISYLLIGAATDNALKTNTDHFQKRPKREDGMCIHCASTALYTLQTFAPSGGGGGDGKFTSLRGGGPLSTIVLGENLWETLWLNVLAGGTFDKRECNEKTFPWLKLESYLSDKIAVKTIHSKHMNPEHVFWGMPRRIQLKFSNLTTPSQCYVCGEPVIKICHSYYDASGGLTYQDGKKSKKTPSWINPLHPLSPYNIGEDGKPSAVHPQPGGINYRHWLAYIENTVEGNINRTPSKTIEQFRTMVREEGRFWAYGYDMDNMKARCWYDSIMPIFSGDDALLITSYASNMLKSSRYVSGLILSSFFKATMMEPVGKEGAEVIWNWPKQILNHLKVANQEKVESVKAKINDFVEALEPRIEKNLLSKPISIRNQFWSETEPSYFNTLNKLKKSISSESDDEKYLSEWLILLKKTAINIFDVFSSDGDFDAASPKSIALARNELSAKLNSNFLRKKVGLPPVNRNETQTSGGGENEPN